MRGKKAKELRKKSYGDLSLKGDRKYQRSLTGIIRNKPDSPRAKYQESKKI